MPGAILQLSVSRGGIPKLPVPFALATPLGLDSDAVAHPKIHGGRPQAVLIVTAEALDHLASLGYPLFPGALGENLTTRGVDHRLFRPGQQYRAGLSILELTRPRGPCAALDVYGASLRNDLFDPQVKAGDPASPCWGLSGFYASVVQPGLIRTGDPFQLLSDLA
jgi:MOSC domain-containing protein YiiM